MLPVKQFEEVFPPSSSHLKRDFKIEIIIIIINFILIWHKKP